MGMFSWNCKRCGRSIADGEIGRANGYIGIYNGYGRFGGLDVGQGLDDPIVWHELCYQKASDEQRQDQTPSEVAADQGMHEGRKEFRSFESIKKAAKLNHERNAPESKKSLYDQHPKAEDVGFKMPDIKPRLTELIRESQIRIEALTEQQFVDALVQALPDFQRLVSVCGQSQAVTYAPGAEADH